MTIVDSKENLKVLKSLPVSNQKLIIALLKRNIIPNKPINS